MNLREKLTFGFEQTFTTPDWWTEEGFTSVSDTPMKREKMKELADELAIELQGKVKESQDIWKHLQYEVGDKSGNTQFYVTMDPGSIEVKTPPCVIDEVEIMAIPLFKASERAGLVPYRNWWYGVRSGTEGGCHVNMGGHTQASNPLYDSPELVVKYSAYIHNRPFLHWPFMGVDVGPGGNAMRMDEKEDFDTVKSRFDDYRELYNNGGSLSPEETFEFFSETNLILEKSSFPSLKKFQPKEEFLIEDRAQEALRSPEDFRLVCELRIQILDELKNKDCEPLREFEDLHGERLTSFELWKKFQLWAKDFDLETEKYERFFERQFPVLSSGDNKPENVFINEGRRPRIITDIQKRGDVITSKTIDTSYKRFEIYTYDLSADIEIDVAGLEHKSDIKTVGDIQYIYADIKYSQETPVIDIRFLKDGEIVEWSKFNIHNMMWE